MFTALCVVMWPSCLLQCSLMLVVLFCLFMSLLLSSCVVHAKKIVVYWNSSNPIFRISNTDNVIDVNSGEDHDQLTVVCPSYNSSTNWAQTDKYMIYNVSRRDYETCRITNPSARIIAVCNKPFKKLFFTITFRPFTPQPGGLEFHPGQDYYFISTSTRDDPNRRVGGSCRTHNTRLVFKVCCGRDRQTANQHSLHTSTARDVAWQNSGEHVADSQDILRPATTASDHWHNQTLPVISVQHNSTSSHNDGSTWSHRDVSSTSRSVSAGSSQLIDHSSFCWLHSAVLLTAAAFSRVSAFSSIH